jgi:vesicle transport through interaction with t-SNAREs protein 1
MVSAEKSKLHGRLKTYREDYQARLTQLQAIKQEIEGFEEKVGAGPNRCCHAEATFDIQGEIRTNALLDRSTNSLEQSRQLVANTEIIGKNVITDLESQREQLLGAKENLSETKDFAGTAKRLLRSMGRKALMQRFTLILSIISLFVVICLIIYFGLAKKF